MKRKTVTLKDIAKEIGVSSYTVSRALRDSTEISAAMKKKIKKLASELGYIPNSVASSLKTGRTNLVGVVFDSMVNPYFTIMTSEIQQELKKYDLDLMVFSTQDPFLDMKTFNLIYSRKIDAIITFVEPNDNVIELANKNATPLVLVGIKTSNAHIDAFTTDDLKGGYLAGETLIKNGSKRIAYVGFEPMGECAKRRLDGLEKSLNDHQLSLNKADVFNIKHVSEIELILDKLYEYDGIFCFNDMIAYDCLFLLDPKNVNIVGYDNIQQELFSVHALTSISAKKDEIAQGVVARIMDRLSNVETQNYVNIEYDVEVINNRIQKNNIK